MLARLKASLVMSWSKRGRKVYDIYTLFLQSKFIMVSMLKMGIS
jgi:hypothetical protein